MNTLVNYGKRSIILAATVLFVIGCSKDDNDNPNEDEQLTQTELKTILETDDISGAADSALAELFMDDSNGQTAKASNECYSAEYTDTGYTATFNNCNLNGTDNVNGTLTVVYATEGESASFTATYTDFYVGDIKLNGTRSYTVDGNSDESSISFSVTSNMTVTMADGSTISEEGTKTFGFAYDESSESFTFTLAGNWTVELDGNTYSVAVIDTLEGTLGCGYLTNGTMEVSKNGLEVTVDFGDGECDDIVTVIYPNGATEDVSIKD